MDIEYSLHPAQLKVWTSPKRFRVVVAGRRSGKTVLAIHELMRAAFSRPKSLNWYIAPTYRQAKMIAWRMLKDIIPPQLITSYNEVELSVKTIDGSSIELRGADNPDSLRGVGVNFAVLDEYADMKRNVFHEIIRPMLTDTRGSALFIGTPKGKNALWELWLKGQKDDVDFQSWSFKTIDNPFIDPLEVEHAKQELPERVFKQEYEASFEDYTGLVFPEFSQDIHVIPPMRLESHWKRIGAIDPALKGTTGALKTCITDDGDFIVYSEYYEQDKRVSEIAPRLKEDGIKWYIDPASLGAKTEREGQLYNLYDEYREYGIHVSSAENDVSAGINRVGEYFKTGKIKIFSTCKNLVYELERYHWAEDRESRLGMINPAPYKSMDHLVDCLRYVIATHTKPSVPREEPINPNSAWGRMLEDRNRRKQEVYL